MRGLITLLMACLLLSSTCMAGPLEVRYWDWGRTPKRDDYQFAVLRLALERSAARHGEFHLQRIVADYSTLRSRQEVSAGTTVNVQAGPWRVLNQTSASDQRIPVNIPIMSGLLGYRVLVIRKEDAAKFAAIRGAGELKALVAGQGREWAELGLYRREGYRVMDSGNINTLLAMLVNKRFDYLPMSITEASSALVRHADLTGQLMIAPNLIISYPLPTIFYVSARHPDLARRIEDGLTLAQQDGSLVEMSRIYFAKEIASLAGVTRHYSLADPTVPKSLLLPLPSPYKSGKTPR